MKNKIVDPNKPQPILSTKAALVYSVGIMGVQLMIGLLNSFQTEFLNKMYSAFDNHILIAAAIIIFVAKIISCLSDPIIGSIIDRSHLKGGKMRPFILMSAFPLAILTVVMFIKIPFQSAGAAGKPLMYAYITVTTILWNVAMSFADIPSQGMLSVLSPRVSERNKAAGIANTFRNIGLSAAGLMMTFVMLVVDAIKGSKDYSGRDELSFIATAAFIAGVGMICYLLIYWCNREKVTLTQSSTVTMREMFHELKDNKQIRLVFLSYLIGFARGMAMCVCVQVGGAMLGAPVYFPGLSEALAGGQPLDPTSNATWLIGVTSAATSFVALIVVPFINKKWGEKKTFIVMSIYGGVTCLAGFIAYCCLPATSIFRSGLNALWFIWVVQFVVSFMFGYQNYLPTVMTADIVEYQEWKNGFSRPGVDYGILSLSHKLAAALAVAVGTLIVGLSGYTHQLYLNGAITPKMQNILFFAYIGFPGIGCLLSMIPIFWYKIDDKTKKQMREELAARRAATAEQAEEAPAEAEAAVEAPAELGE